MNELQLMINISNSSFDITNRFRQQIRMDYSQRKCECHSTESK